MWYAWERRESVEGFGGKPEGKRPLRRPRCRWEDGIRVDLGEIDGGVCSGFILLRIGAEPLGCGAMELLNHRERNRHLRMVTSVGVNPDLAFIKHYWPSSWWSVTYTFHGSVHINKAITQQFQLGVLSRKVIQPMFLNFFGHYQVIKCMVCTCHK
jgi:hypothetical protein